MFDDIELKLFKFRKPKNVYTRNINHSIQVGKDVQAFNPTFSETFFATWVQTMFIRYSFLISFSQTDKIMQFEKVHLLNENKKEYRKILNLYNLFDDLQFNFVDLFEFSHSDAKDVLKVKISITGIGEKGKTYADGIKEQITNTYTIEFVKDNSHVGKNYDFKSNCPNCGAPTKIVTYGVCDHCQELVSIYDNVWKINYIVLDE